MAETIEERLRREDDAKEVKSYNELVNKINELIPKIVEQFSIMLPEDHVWVSGIVDSNPKVAWRLYRDYHEGAYAWITSEGYLLIRQVKPDKQKPLRFMIKTLSIISNVGERIPVSLDSNTSIRRSSSYLADIYSSLDDFYCKNQKMIDAKQM